MVKQNNMIQLIVLTNRCGKRERATSVTQTKVNCYKSNRGCRGYSNICHQQPLLYCVKIFGNTQIVIK